jgi:hypothetical protein
MRTSGATSQSNGCGERASQYFGLSNGILVTGILFVGGRMLEGTENLLGVFIECSASVVRLACFEARGLRLCFHVVVLQ